MTRCLPGRHGRAVRSSHFLFTIASLFAWLFAVTTLAAAAPLGGKVVDTGNHRIANATVLVVKGSAVIASIATSADGTFGPLALPDGEYTITVSAPGLRATPRSVTLPATGDLEIRLAPAAVSESVVVSASSVDVPLSHAGDSVTVIDRADLRTHQVETVPDAMRLVPGVHVASNGGRGTVTSFFPRGGESDYTLVLVDGIPQNAFGGGFDASHLTTADIDRIEVVRGPQSALFGDGAIGGIVQIVTRRGGPLRGDAFFEGGGYGTKHGSASAAGSAGHWSWGAAGDGLFTDGDTRAFPNIGTVSNNKYWEGNGSGSASWSDSADRTITFTARGGQNRIGTPGPYGSDPLGRYDGLDTVSHGTNTTEEIGGSAILGATKTIRHHVDATFANFKSAFTSPFGPSDDRTRRFTARYQIDLERQPVAISAGAELQREQEDYTYIENESFEPVPVKRTTTGLFVEARPSLGDRLFVTGGVRLEDIARESLVTDGSRPDFDRDVVWSANPKVTAAWFLSTPGASDWTKIHGSAGTGIKPPTGFDIAFTNNPNLKPERSRSGDIGIEQSFANARGVVDATFFANRYEDLIVTIGSAFTGVSRYKTDNVANARARGVELSASWNAGHGVTVRGGWTVLSSAVLGVNTLPDVAQKPFAVGQALIRRPKESGSLDLTWKSPRAAAFFTVDGRGQMNDIEPNFGDTVLPNPGYAVVNFGGSFRVVPGIEITGRVTNAFDRSYEEVLGFPALGRSAMIGVRVASRH